MKRMTPKAFLRDNQTFLSLYALLLLAGLYPLLNWDKISLLLMINSQYHPKLDQLFYYITHLGSAITYIAMLLMLFLLKISNRKLLIGTTSFVIMSFIVQFTKRIIFPEQLRPLELVPDPNQLHLVDQVEILSELSFPSGHAATIFTAVFFLNFIMPAKKSFYSLLWILLATIVAYSRIYLCQHFYIDVYVGMLIGGLVTTLTYIYLINWQVPDWLAHKLPIKI
jgi:membrane-associated phospholipid phosphatase